MTTHTDPWISGRDDAEIIRPFGNEMKVMLPAEHTAGACSVLFSELKSGEGAPPHLHHEYDEYFFVVEGELSFVIAGKESTLVAGNFAFTPARRRAFVHKPWHFDSEPPGVDRPGRERALFPCSLRNGG
jgi:mannose-6-phosphate isomerase-like protein (cupin superfamily)